MLRFLVLFGLAQMLALAQGGAAAQPSPGAGVSARQGLLDPVIVGTVLPQSGAQAELAEGYRKGLLLWQGEINAAGGLLGRPVELRILDDGSDAPRAAKLYEQLVGEEKAQLLIGPFGTAATLMGAAVAERAGRVMINAGSASRQAHRGGPGHVFQSVTPYAAYGEAAIVLAHSQGLRSVYLIARDDPASREMGEAAQKEAARLGLAAEGLEFHSGSGADFAPQVKKAQAAGADAWIAFGSARDAADMVQTFKRLKYAPRLFFARGAADPKFISLVGQDAELSVGAEDYDPRLPGAANERFVKAWRERWPGEPGAAAAQGYAGGMVLAEAVRRAGTLDQDKLRQALAALQTETVLGLYKVDPASGAQIAAKPVLVQIIKGRPEMVSTQSGVYPYVAWNERRVIK